uniref:Uncharacterized protein n=1 Tax=Cannabis sativa TaxID=3483 RepID=A0A803Q7X3_CANSA
MGRLSHTNKGTVWYKTCVARRLHLADKGIRGAVRQKGCMQCAQYHDLIHGTISNSMLETWTRHLRGDIFFSFHSKPPTPSPWKASECPLVVGVQEHLTRPVSMYALTFIRRSLFLPYLGRLWRLSGLGGETLRLRWA